MAITGYSPPTPEKTPERQVVNSTQSAETSDPKPTSGIKIQLYFGLLSDHRPEVSEPEWQNFLDTVITPVFPNLSISKLQGQWVSEGDGTIVKEPSRCVEIICEDEPGVHCDCAKIAAKFKTVFLQDSVMRVVTRCVTPCQYYFH